MGLTALLEPVDHSQPGNEIHGAEIPWLLG